MKTFCYYTYIVQCADGTFYIGSTPEVQKRIKQHNGQLRGGAKYTRNRRPVILRYTEAYMTRSSAMQREYQLKQLTHKQKAILCNEATTTDQMNLVR